MKIKKKLLCILCANLLTISIVGAAPISYRQLGLNGNINTETYNFTAKANDDIIAYYVGATAGYTNSISLLVNGIDREISGLFNHNFNGNSRAEYGQSLNFGLVEKGDSLIFKLNTNLTSSNPFSLFSEPSMNKLDNGLNHIYSKSYIGDSIIPKGTYIGFEDLIWGGDKDYDDEQFVFTNTGVTPIPAAIWLFGSGVIGLISLGKRKRPI